MGSTTASMLALLVLGAAAIRAPESAHAAQTQAFAFTTDFSSGAISDIQFGPPRTVNADQATVSSDAVLRYLAGDLYVVNRFGFDNILILDPANDYGTVEQFSVGNGANPHDVELASPTKAYVTRYDTPELWIMNPQTGAHTGTISLAAFADDDGIPEMDRLALRNGRLFVSVQRLDRNNFFSPTDSSQIVVINATTDAIIDANTGAPGVQGIVLPFQNPLTELVVDSSGRIVVGCVGSFGVLDGGIVRIDPATLTIAATEITEAALGGEINDVAVLDAARGFAVINDASFNTLLRSYNRNTGTTTGTPFSTAGFSIADIEINDRSELWLCDRTPANPGVRIFDATTPLGTGLPPQDLVFDVATVVSVPAESEAVPAAPLAIVGVSPNPSTDVSRIRFRLAASQGGLGETASLAIYDMSGRAVFRAALDGLTPGEHVFEWDGRDSRGGRVASGVYGVEVRAAASRSVARIVRF
jgi:hypothetical protein